jgi:hypothetical protein
MVVEYLEMEILSFWIFKKEEAFFSFLKIRVDFASKIIFDVRIKNVSLQEDATITFTHCML